MAPVRALCLSSSFVAVAELGSFDGRHTVLMCMCASSCERSVVTAVRWSLLVNALAMASAAPLTTFPWPVWTQAMGTEAWTVGMVVPEIALWLVPLPVCFAAAALWLGRGRGGRRWLTGITVVLCAVAVIVVL